MGRRCLIPAKVKGLAAKAPGLQLKAENYVLSSETMSLETSQIGYKIFRRCQCFGENGSISEACHVLHVT